MLRLFIVFLVAVASSATLCGQETKRAPAAMKRVIDKAVAEVRRNRQDFEKANQTPLEDARQELQDLAQNLIADGKTDEATAVLRQVKTLEADVLRIAKAPEPTAIGAGRGVSQKALVERLAGTWVHPNRAEKRIFNTDGTFTQLRSDGGVEAGPQLFGSDGEKATCHFPTQFRFEAWLIDDDRVAFVYYAPNGALVGDGEVWFRKK
jgi:hypothetical protein